jgi:endoribonuclease Dicer
MIVMEGCRSLGLEIKTEYALEAFTKDSDNTEEHRAMQLHVQRGMGKNYERLEFLGDCFLKMGTTISLFARRPDDDEYDYHVHRMCLICNKNLFNVATKLRLYEHIRSRGFSRHTWYPPGLTLLHGRNYVKHIASESSHNLGEKTIADVCEALIAAALLTGGKDHRFDMAVRAVTLFADNDNHTATCWADYLASYTKPAYQVQASDGAERDLANKVLEKLGYRFNFPRLLRSAFTHPSYPSVYAKVPCYQRLEFLGDALLDLACVEYLFHRYPDKDPQWLTEHKVSRCIF